MKRPGWLRLPGLRGQIALAVWGAVMITNTMASSMALQTVEDSNHRTAVTKATAVEEAQTAVWLANPDATAAEYGKARRRGDEQVSVWQVGAKALQQSEYEGPNVQIEGKATWAAGAPAPGYISLEQVGSGAGKHWRGIGETTGFTTQVFPRGDGTLLVVSELYYDGVDWLAQEQLRTDLERQGWALGLLSALGAWLLSGALMAPARRASAVAARLGQGELTARVPVRGRDEIAQLGTQMNEMAGNLQQMMDAQRHFISDTAHELRTPTAALLASAAALDDPSTREEAAELVSPQLRRLSSLTEDLLALSRFDDGREARDDQVVDLVDLTERAARQVAGGADVRVRSEGPVFAIVDPARISTIVRNLVANGLKHGEAPVVVVVSEQGEDGVIRVHDAGPGVPAEQREAIFNRFVRGDEARHGEGAGLGLAIARENAELHGGSLTLGPDGHGFTLRLPLSPAPVEESTGHGLMPTERGSSALVGPVSTWPSPSMVAAGLFWNGAVMVAWDPLLSPFLGDSPVLWGDQPGSGMLEEFPWMVGLPTLLVLAGRAVAIHRGARHVWRWQAAALAPLVLYALFSWRQADLTMALLVAFGLWTMTTRRHPDAG